MRLLDKFELIRILHQENNKGFEPFDRHNCGRMALSNLKKCLDIIFNRGPENTEQLNRIYSETAKRRLSVIGERGVVGFKMRIRPRRPYPLHVDAFPGWNDYWQEKYFELYIQSFKIAIFDILKRHDVIVLMAVRQDVLRLALSKYHGDGKGNPGHLQFELARGVIDRNNIGKINVECGRLEEIVSECESLHQEDRLLMEEIRQAGIQAHPILYEEFVTDKCSYLDRLFRILELEITNDEITQVLS